MVQLLRNDLDVSLNAENEDHDLQPLISLILSSLRGVFLQTHGDAFSYAYFSFFRLITF